VLSKPVGFLDKLEWYWCDKNNELKSMSHYLDTRDKLASSHYDENWYPIKDHKGRHLRPKYDWVTHENFWGAFDEFMSRDIITNPFILFGYTTNAGTGKLVRDIKTKKPNVKPHPNLLPELRKRKNIVVYKENIEHLAYNIYAGVDTGPTHEKKTQFLNDLIMFQKLMPSILESYDIPYEMFSLDSGSYSKTFDLDKVLPRDSSDKLFVHDIDVRQQVSDFMMSYASNV